MKQVLLLVMLTTLLSCHTTKWANKKIDKVNQYHPELMASKCAVLFPSIDSVSVITNYITGKTDTSYDTLTTVENSIVTKYITKTLFRTDTISKVSTIVKVNKAKEIDLANKLTDQIKTNILQESKIKLKNRYLLLSLLLIVIMGIYIYIKTIKHKI